MGDKKSHFLNKVDSMALLALGMVGKEVRQRVDDALPREETLVGKTGFERILVDYWAPAALFFVFHLEM